MPEAVNKELWLIALLILGATGAGLITGYFWHAALLTVLAYLFYLFRNLVHLYRWLGTKQKQSPPEATGLWGEVFNQIYLLENGTNQTHEALRAMASRFQQAASALPDAMVILRSDYSIEWSNPAAGRLLGIAEPGDTGRQITNLIRHPMFRQFLNADADEGLSMNSPVLTDRSIVLKLVPYGINQKLLIGRDTTRIARLETMRSKFVANVSHELRSPLTVLSGYLETLKETPVTDPKVLERAISNMYSQSRRMERLVSDLLSLSRLETDAPHGLDTVVDVDAMLAGVRESAEVLSSEAAHKIIYEVEPSLDLRGDADELHSLFANLVNNAICYTPKGGEIRICWQRKNGGAEFLVADTGPGIAPNHIPRLTERFYRVDIDRSRETGGTGLGLAIVKHVLDRHDGKLEIDSELGMGSTFRCLFPSERVVNSTSTN